MQHKGLCEEELGACGGRVRTEPDEVRALLP